MSDVQILSFHAEWCSPCDKQEELLEDFDAAPVEPIDVDEDMERANEYSVRSVPTLVVEVDGEPVQRFNGLTPPAELEETVNRNS